MSSKSSGYSFDIVWCARGVKGAAFSGFCNSILVYVENDFELNMAKLRKHYSIVSVRVHLNGHNPIVSGLVDD